MFSLLTTRQIRFVATPALSPIRLRSALARCRSGKILRRVLSHRQPSVLRQFSPASHPPAATGNSISESSQRARSLSPTHEPVAKPLLSRPAATLSSPSEGEEREGRGVVGFMGTNRGFSRAVESLPGGEGQGEGERHTDLLSHNDVVRGMIVRGMETQSEEFSLRIPLTIIPLTLRLCVFAPFRFELLALRNVRLHSRRAWTIVPHGSAGRHRGRRVGRVVCHDPARTLARQRRVVGALSVHRRFA